MPSENDAVEFGRRMRDHLEQVEKANAFVLNEVADLLLDVVRRDGLIYTAGTGHSIALVLETFYRAGGLACVHPLHHPGLLPLTGGVASTLIERTSGLAALLVAEASPSDRDAGVVFSNSGVNPVPVELAEELKRAGTTVVAFVSVAHMEQAPARAGRKLGDVADHVIDTLTPPGDAAFTAGRARTAALSSLSAVFAWNLLLARLAERAVEEDVDLPVWTSANVAGGDEANRALVSRYRRRIPGL